MIRRNGSGKKSRPEISTVGEALAHAEAALRSGGLDDAGTEAAFLLAHLLHTDRGGLMVRRDQALPDGLRRTFGAWIERRSRREPAQHLTAESEFYGRAFHVDARALVPRPETEGLVDAVLGLGLGDEARLIDLGTGSGCIAVTLAAERPGWRLVAVDLSPPALDLAETNIARHRVGDRVETMLADMLELPRELDGGFDAVVSNPPYVAESDWATLQPEVRDHDPRMALVGGPCGQETIARMLPAIGRLFRPHGRIALEIGAGQSPGVRSLLTAAGFRNVETHRDLQGIERILTAVHS